MKLKTFEKSASLQLKNIVLLFHAIKSFFFFWEKLSNSVFYRVKGQIQPTW